MSKVSRRRFLEDSLFGIAALGAASAGLSAFSPAPVFSQENVSPNEKLGVMLVGCGDRGGAHIGFFSKDKRTIILTVCDPDENNGKRRCDELEKSQGVRPKYVKDMREGFQDESIDIVTCATTNHWHTLTGVWAMQAGKHCYIEKPISHNVFEGKAITAAAKKYGCICQTGTQCRSNPANIEAVKFIRSGGIGEVKFSRGLCYKRRKSIGALGKFDPPKELDYSIWSGPAQILPVTRQRFHYDWHWQRVYGNGDLGNQGPHQTDIARWHLGLDRYPNSVISYGGRLGYQAERKDPSYIDAGDTANTEISIYDYGDMCIVFETRGLETPSMKTPVGPGQASIGVITYGSEGYMVQQQYGYSVAIDLQGKIIKEFKGGHDGLHYGNFVEAVQKNDPSMLNSDARCGALSAGLSHIGNISYYLGEKNHVSVAEAKKVLSGIKSLDNNIETLERTVEHLESEKNKVDLKKYPLSMGPLLKFDPEKEVFIDNAEANKMITRDYRTPYVVPSEDEV